MYNDEYGYLLQRDNKDIQQRHIVLIRSLIYQYGEIQYIGYPIQYVEKVVRLCRIG